MTNPYPNPARSDLVYPVGEGVPLNASLQKPATGGATDQLLPRLFDLIKVILCCILISESQDELSPLTKAVKSLALLVLPWV